MKHYTAYLIFLLKVISEKMFVIVAAFLFGYCLGYYSFEIFKYKNKKHKINEFFSSYNKKYGVQYGSFDEKTRGNKNKCRCFLGNDLTFEQRFLSKLIEKIEQEIEQEKIECEVSYLHKKSMSICCETSIMTETIARKLLKLTDQLMDEHFFEKDGLRKLGWCSNYMLDRRTHNYHKNKELFKKMKLLNFIGSIARQIDSIIKKLFQK